MANNLFEIPICKSAAFRLISGLSFFILGAVLSISDASASSYKQVRDWHVFCDQALVCSLQTSPVEGAKPNAGHVYNFTLERGTRADAPLKLQIAMNGSPNEETDILISIPGVLEELYYPIQSGEFGGGVWTITDANLIDLLLPAMAKGSQMHVSVETSEASGTVAFSLSGVVGSLLYLDESQGRIDRRDALQAKGNLPAQDVETRVRVLKSSKELPRPVHALWSSNHDYCADDERDLIAQYEGFKVEMESEGALYFLPCGGPGAYNYPVSLYVHYAQDNAARAVSFPTLGAEGPTNMSSAYNISWNDKTSEVSAFFKGRGLGDCGTQHKWKWREANSVHGELELVEERAKGDCDGEHGEFPLIWPPD